MSVLDDLRRRADELGREHAAEVEALEPEAGARLALARLAAAGFTTWCVPERDGGASTEGLVGPGTVSVRALCVLRETLAWHAGLLDLAFVMQGLGSYPIALGGREELRRAILPAVAGGSRIAAFALTEPGAGSSLGEIETRAEHGPEGWRLDGRKTFISNAGLADFYTVLARTSGTPGDGGRGSLTMFFVAADAPGLRVEPFELLAPHPIGEVVLEQVAVPDDDVLGAVGDGLELALQTLARFRTSVAAAAVGFSRRALSESVSRLSQRRQFGRPLAANQALRFDLAEMDVRIAAAAALVERAAEAVDHGLEATREVARAKYWATETASWACDRAVQHWGGLGVKRGTIVERLFREVRALRIYEGTSEIQKLILAKEILAAEEP